MAEKEKKSVEDAVEKLQKKYGDSVLLQMDADVDFKVEAIPTGCFSLDEAFGCGGLPRGRIIEVFGQESSGKSTLTTFLISQIQKGGGRAALIDAENAFDGDYARAIGVDISKLMVAQPGTLEECMDITRELVQTGAFDIIVVDSVAAMVPKSELEGEEMLKESMAVQARLMGKALRILTGPIAKSKTVVIFINQLRSKVGIFFGKKETTPGGKALKFFSSVRIDVQKGEKILGKDDEQIGNWMNLTMVKNKVGLPWRKASFELYYKKGIDLIGDTLDYAEKIGIVKKTGNTYSFDKSGVDLKLGVGRENAKKFLNNNPGTVTLIRKDIEEHVKNKK